MNLTAFRPSDHYIGEARAAVTDETLRRVTKLIRDHVDYEGRDIAPTSNLITDLGLDELDYVELLMAAEHEFGINLEERTSFSITVAEFAADVAQGIRESLPA